MKFEIWSSWPPTFCILEDDGLKPEMEIRQAFSQTFSNFEIIAEERYDKNLPRDNQVDKSFISRTLPQAIDDHFLWYCLEIYRWRWRRSSLKFNWEGQKSTFERCWIMVQDSRWGKRIFDRFAGRQGQNRQKVSLVWGYPSLNEL